MANRRFIDFPIASSVGDNDIILIWQSGANKQTTKATFLSGLPENLDELNDVAISGLTNGQILRYDSVTGKWENTDQGNLDLNDLNDVSIVSPSNGQVLVYNSSTSKWENSSGGFVPYVGAVTTVDLGAQGLRAGYVRFDTSVASVPQEQGLMYWDSTKSTVALIMNGTLQHIGQDTFFYCKNSTGSSIPKGTSVRFAGTDGASGHILITPFLANGSVPSNYFIGVTAEAIANGAFGQVMHFGELDGINTSGYTAGALLYASTTVAGAFQTTAPVAPNNIVLVAAAVNSKNNGAIVVRPTYGSNINTDEGVKITSGATGDLLQLQAGGLWENKTVAQVVGSGYVPVSRTITINGTSQDLSANRTYNVGTVTSVGLSSATSGVTIGSTPVTTSGTITLAIATASGSQNGLLSSTDWTTFNSKQNALTNPVTGTGASGQVAYFNGTSAITGESGLTWDATNNNLSIGGATANSNLTVSGSDNTDIFTVLSGANSRLHVGTVTSPSVSTYIRSQNNYALKLGTNSTNYLSIFNSGNVFIGTSESDDGAKLQVNGSANISGNIVLTNGANRILRISSSTSYYYDLQTVGDDFQIREAGSTPRLTIKFPSGNIGIGTSSPTNPLHIQSNTLSQLNVTALSGNTNAQINLEPTGTGIAIIGPANNVDFAFRTNATERLRISSTGQLLINSQTSANDNVFKFFIDNTLASIQATYNTTGSYVPIRFLTSDTERMRITSSGNVLIGTQTDSGAKFRVFGTGVSANIYSDNNTYSLGLGYQGTLHGYLGGISSALYALSNNGGQVLLNSSSVWVPVSDVKRKRNFENYNLGLNAILGLNPKYYHMDFQKDTEEKQVGLVAQEVKEFIPLAYEENGDFIGLNYNAIIVTMVKAIQELKQEIDTLKN